VIFLLRGTEMIGLMTVYLQKAFIVLLAILNMKQMPLSLEDEYTSHEFTY
jgi:hypothetical protein